LYLPGFVIHRKDIFGILTQNKIKNWRELMASENVKCPKCGHENEPSSTDCGKCGITFEVYSDVQENKSKPPEKKKSPPQKKEPLFKCPKCGHGSDLVTDDCLKCGILFLRYYETMEPLEPEDKEKVAFLKKHRAEQEKLAAEEKQKQEAERQEALMRQKEERARQEAIKKEKEEAERQEAVRKEKEEAERQEAVRKEKEEAEHQEAIRKEKEEAEQQEAIRLEKEEAEHQEAVRKEKEEKERNEALVKQQEEEEYQQAFQKKRTDEEQRLDALKNKADEEAARLSELQTQRETEEQQQALCKKEEEEMRRASLEADTILKAIKSNGRFVDLLKKYEGSFVGLNLKIPGEIEPVELIKVNDDHFTILTEDHKMAYSIPLNNIFTIAEGTDGVSTRVVIDDKMLAIIIKIIRSPEGV
jgi:hypothetical protein